MRGDVDWWGNNDLLLSSGNSTEDISMTGKMDFRFIHILATLRDFKMRRRILHVNCHVDSIQSLLFLNPLNYTASYNLHFASHSSKVLIVKRI